MTLIRKPFRRLFDATRATLGRGRSGSILILVVALLVLLLLIGTAFLSTSRSERYAAVQDQVNTQADLLLQGVENLLSGQIVGKLFNAPGGQSNASAYRYAATALAQYYNNYDSPTADLYLAARVPVQPTSASDPLTTIVHWPTVSLPPVTSSSGTATAGSPVAEFDAADGSRVVFIWAYDTSGSTTYTKGDVVTVVGGQSVYYTPVGSTSSDPTTVAGSTNWTMVDPKAAFRFVPTTATTAGQTSPAFYIYNTLAPGYQPVFNANGTKVAAVAKPNSAFGGSQIATYVMPAADVDGDGIADGGMVQLPIGQIDGITYYAGTRVVDNNSAVNVSSAWDASTDADSSGNNNYLGMFRPHVGLKQLLDSSSGQAATEITSLNASRFGFASGYATPTANQATPYLNSTTSRSDFKYLTAGNALDDELVRRPLNPGYNADASANYRWLGTSATLPLATRFCLKGSSGATSEVETDLLNDTVTTVKASAPYDPAAATTKWYPQNFAFTPNASGPNSTAMPVRALLTGSNPVSNAVSGHYRSRGTYSPTAVYYFGDWVTVSISTGGTRSYLCVYDGTTGQNPSTIVPPVPATPAGSPLQTVPTTYAANKYWEFVPWTTTPVKASANASTFGQLWAAYWNVMWDHPFPVASGTQTDQSTGFDQPAFGYPISGGYPTDNQGANNEIAVGAPDTRARMFRNPIRDPGTVTPGKSATVQYLTPGQTMLLRSATAALNTISLRQASGTTNPSATTALDNVISRQITIPPDPADTTGNHTYDVMLFGATKQPYISEVYVVTDPDEPFIAIELCNPYPYPIPLKGWQIGVMNRTTAGYATMKPAPLATATDSDLTSLTQIPAASPAGPGLLILQSANVPSGLTLPTSSATVTVSTAIQTLANGVGTSEYVILRPRSNDGTPSKSSDPNNTYDENGSGSTFNLAEMVPVDQIDTSGLTATGTKEYDYRRADNTVGSTGTNAWQWVYPGGYSFNTTTAPNRHVGLVDVTSQPIASQQSLGTYKTAYTGATPPATPGATYQTFPVQIANTDSAGFNQATAAGPNKFPFGGFARNGDLMQVPFCGAYRVLLAGTSTMTTPPTGETAATQVVEFNSLPMDFAFADDQDLTDDETTSALTAPTTQTPPYAMWEQLGRFCPVGDPAVTTALGGDFLSASSNPIVNGTTVVAPNSNMYWRYHWATKLFDFVTVQAPQDDYLPNVDPYDYPAAVPVGVANRSSSTINATTAGTSEDTVGVEGLVNINTAPWPVLATIPFFPAGSDAYTYTQGSNGNGSAAVDSIDDNANLAQAIVDYRNANGAFRSLYDLYKVPFFKFVNDKLIQTAEPGTTTGDFSPNTPGTTDSVRLDFEERFLLLNRVSNLLTTRSDTFTCYVLLQGWRGVSTGNPTLVVQRRAAYLLDRTGVTPSNTQASTFPVPTN